jgi:YD repeat-containing protein
LVGITSSTDPAGIATYYEYDPFGRLSIIRDAKSNIIKKYDYHYASQD